MPLRSDAVDIPPKLKNDHSTSGSRKPSPVFIPPHQIDRQVSNPLVTALSPPPGQLQHKKSHFRLRSDSGLALHANQAAFRHFTHYNADGTAAARPLPVRTMSHDGNSSEEEFSLGDQPSTELKGLMSHGTLLPDFFELPVIKLAFSHPETGQKLRKFAETRLGGTDIDFMLKVEEYSRELGNVISSISHISKNFTGTTATSPLGLPLDVANALRCNTKYCARTALPALDKLYQNAKATVEERLSQHLYPEFVKYQLSQCLTASLSTSRFVTGKFKSPYPGLGDAFCLSDPLLPDNPLIYVSDGLLATSGLRRHEITGKNGRVMQGIATDAEAARRLSDAVTSGREVTELILNYRSDGTPFWNFLFLCPLMENGSVRFFFGAQVNVSDNMGHEHKDILSVLNFGPPPEDFHSSPNPASPASSSNWPLRPSCDTVEPYRQDDQASEKSRAPRRPGFFSRFRRKSTTSSRSPSLPRPSMSCGRTTEDALPLPPTSPPRPSFHPSPLSPSLSSSHHLPQQHQLPQPQQLDEHSTPYARFFILRFTPPPSSSSTSSSAPASASRPATSTSSPSPTPSTNPERPALSIAFCSRFALALLGLRHTADEIATAPPSLVGRDIFTLLPGPSRAWRGNVVGRLARGESVRAEMVIPPGQGRGNKLWGGGSGGSGRGGVGEGREGRPRRSETLERGAELLRQALKGGSVSGGGGGQGKMRRFVSNWVPLKDVEGMIGFVVLVLTPVVERGAAPGSG